MTAPIPPRIAPPLPAALPPAKQDPLDAIVDRWVAEVFFNAGLDTQIINRIRASKERLKTDLAALRKD